jgi:hypothetical protein
MLKNHDFQLHPAQLYIFEKTKQNKLLRRAMGNACKPARDTEQVCWQWVNACMTPRKLHRGTEQARWQRSNVG